LTPVHAGLRGFTWVGQEISIKMHRLCIGHA